MNEQQAAAVGRIKAAAEAHAETYVTVTAADLAAVCGLPAVAATAIGKALAAPAARGLRSVAGTIDIHRAAHLEPLLAAVPA